MTAAAAAGAPGTQARLFRQRLRAWLQPQVSMGVREQRDQAVLLLAVAVVVSPHFAHLPTWANLCVGALWIWRAWLTQNLRPAPGRNLMAVLLILGTGAVWLEHGTLVGRDAGVNLLIVLMALKVLEMRARRDVLVIVFLCLFVLLTEFLYDESLVATLVMCVSVAMLFFVLMSVHLPEGDISFPGKVRYLIRVFLLALPSTFALFFLFPRLPAPAWHIGTGDQSSATGLSNWMAPGSISQLLSSDAVALRAKFDQGIPLPKDLYWRGPVFGYFDGRTWMPATIPADTISGNSVVQVLPSSSIDYTVTLEPTRQRELMAIEFAASVDDVPTTISRLTPTLELRAAMPVSSRLRYRVRSYTSFTVGPTSDDGSLGIWRQLPDDYNPRTRAWAQAMLQQQRTMPPGNGAGAAPPLERRLVNAVLDHFHQAPFRYSLKTPLLGHDPVDEFLFDTHVGYCEHYASSFVVILRAMGIPARVVTGYQGGEINPVDGYLTVRLSDAHAWAEVWMPGRGWVRVDPTAAVAPERVDQSAGERATAGATADGSEAARPWLATLRLNREALENAWNQWFLSYNAERQRALIARIGLHPSIENVSLVALAVFAFVLIALTLTTLRHRVVRDPLAELVLALRAKLTRAGAGVPASTGLRDMGLLLADRLDSNSHARLLEVLADLEQARYARNRSVHLGILRAAVRQWRPVRR